MSGLIINKAGRLKRRDGPKASNGHVWEYFHHNWTQFILDDCPRSLDGTTINNAEWRRKCTKCGYEEYLGHGWDDDRGMYDYWASMDLDHKQCTEDQIPSAQVLWRRIKIWLSRG